MAGERTGKALAARIPLDYHRRPNSVESWKRWLALLALVGAIAWVVVGFRFDAGRPALGDWGRLQASRGPVADVHAAWESDCEACHIPFSPIRSGSWMADVFGHVASVSNTKCQECHQGTAHHDNAAGPELDCASCHRDHRGRDASLVALDDSSCTSCHADLASHRVGSADPRGFAGNITAFVDGGHPEFHALESAESEGDPGRLKFNHALHMTPGIVREPSPSSADSGTPEPGVPYKVARTLDPSGVSRYQKPGQDAQSPVTLDCADCHVADAGDFDLAIAEMPLLGETNDDGRQVIGRDIDDPSGLLISRASGAYMLPITYENQCRTCHPITIDPTDLKSAGLDESLTLTLPHGLQPTALHGYISQAAAARALASGGGGQTSPTDRLAMPGRTGEDEQRTSTLPDSIQRTTAKLETILFSTHQSCYECHHYKSEPNPELSRRDPDEAPTQPSVVLEGGEPPRLRTAGGDLVPLAVVVPNVPQVWLPHGRFDHSAHSAVSCRSCHEAAYSDAPGEQSVTSRDVLIPGVENCRQCHAPASHSADRMRVGGVDHSCTECHGYHNGDAPRQGRGAVALGAGQARTIAEFLNASPPTAEGRSVP